jgi:hypothetical protein
MKKSNSKKLTVPYKPLSSHKINAYLDALNEAASFNRARRPEFAEGLLSANLILRDMFLDRREVK